MVHDASSGRMVVMRGPKVPQGQPGLRVHLVDLQAQQDLRAQLDPQDLRAPQGLQVLALLALPVLQGLQVLQGLPVPQGPGQSTVNWHTSYSTILISSAIRARLLARRRFTRARPLGAQRTTPAVQ